MRATIVPVTIGFLLLSAAAAHAARTSAEICRAAIDRAATTLTAKLMRLELDCLRRQRLGQIEAKVRCAANGHDVTGITHPGTRRRAEATVDRVGTLLARQCSDLALFLLPPDGIGYPVVCPVADTASPCAGDVLSVADVAGCLVCTHVSAVHTMLIAQSAVRSSSCPKAFSVALDIASPVPLMGLEVALAYPVDLDLPGSGIDPSVRDRVTFVPPGGLAVANDRDTDADDRDDTLVLVYVTTNAFQGTFAEVEFCVTGETEPDAARLSCRVASAADAADGTVPNATCHVRRLE